MELVTPHDDADAAPPDEHAEIVPALRPQLDDSSTNNATATSDQKADESHGAGAPQSGGSDSSRPLSEEAQLGGKGEVRPGVADQDASTAARHADVARTEEARTASKDANTASVAAATGHPTPVPYQSVFTIPRPASLTSHIDEWHLRRESTTPTTTGGGNDTSSEDSHEIRAYVERQLGVSTAHEHDDVVPEPNTDSLQLLAVASRSISTPTQAHVEHMQTSDDLQQAGWRKRPRSTGVDDHQIDSGFEPFPPGWHLERPTGTTSASAGDDDDDAGSAELEQGGVPADDVEGGYEPAAQRRRTQGPASPPAAAIDTASSTTHASSQDHLGWRQHRDAVLHEMHAREMAQHLAARPKLFYPTAAAQQPASSGGDMLSSYGSSYYAAPTKPHIPNSIMAASGRRKSAFSGGATSTQWFASGSQAEAYYLAHHHQRDQSDVSYLAGAGHSAAQPAASESRYEGGSEQEEDDRVLSSHGDIGRRPSGGYDSPLPHQLSYLYRGAPAYFQQSTPHQQQYSASYQHPVPRPAGYAASPASTLANTTSMSTATSGSRGGGWFDSPRPDSTATTASSIGMGFSLARSPEAETENETGTGTESRKPIPLRTTSNSRAESYLASIVNYSAPPQSAPPTSGGGGTETRSPSTAASLATAAEGEVTGPSLEMPVASGSRVGPSEGTGKSARGRKGPAANAYAIDSITGMKPFICKLRWLLRNPQEVGQAVTWSSDGSAVLVKIGGDDSKLKDVLRRTFAHENPSAFLRQFTVYGFTQIKDPNELSEVLDPATQPVAIWRAYEDESGTFHRDSLNDLEALRGMVARKKATSSSLSSAAVASGAGAAIQVHGPGVILPPLPGTAAPTTMAPTAATTVPGGVQSTSSFPVVQQQGYAGGSAAFPPPPPQGGRHYYQQQQQQQQQVHPPTSFPYLTPNLAGVEASLSHVQAQGQPEKEAKGEKKHDKEDEEEGTTDSLRDLFRQAATVPRMGGLDPSVAAVRGLLRPVGGGDDEHDVGADGENEKRGSRSKV
ncbi:hypothetical protein JCM3774_006523 [Rhodotorula dairenensis]